MNIFLRCIQGTIQRIALLLISLTLVVTLAGCDFVPILQNSARLTTPIPTPVPTAAPTPTMMPSPTPEPTLSPELKLDKNIKDFLSSSGEFTEEKINSQLLSNRTTEKTELGIFSITEADNPMRGARLFYLQGAFLGYVEEPDRIKLAIGIKDKDRNRFITLLFINKELFNGEFNAVFLIGKLDEKASALRVYAYEVEEVGYINDAITENLEGLTGRVLLFPLLALKANITAEKTESELKFSKIQNSSTEAIYNLFSQACVSFQAESTYGKKARQLAKKDGNVSVAKISSVYEMKINRDSIPQLLRVSYFE